MKQRPQALGQDSGYDFAMLERELDWVKSRVFIDRNSAFYGPMMCNMTMIWSTGIPTAATDGQRIWWNPDWFLSIPKATRPTILVHEMRHPVGLHFLRRGSRDPECWNWACDFNINNGLVREGYTFDGAKGLIDPKFGELPPEDIYDMLMGSKHDWDSDMIMLGGEGEGDMLEPDQETIQNIFSNLVQSSHAARQAGQGGSIPGETEMYLKKFLNPKVRWDKALQLFFNELGGEQDYDWGAKDRRYNDIHLPDMADDDNRLEKDICFGWDVSGSCSDEDVRQQTSEVKHIKDTYNPEKISLFQFDTQITKVQEITEDEAFHDVEIIGRGGTAWAPVKAFLEERKPKIVVIFTDMGFFDPITHLDYKPHFLWVVMNNPHAKIPFGRAVHVST